MIAAHTQLCAALAEWWSRVPPIRFGQLIATASHECDVEDMSDDALLRVTLERIQNDFRSSVVTEESASPELRETIVTEFDRLTARFPQCSAGKLASCVAAKVNQNLYDIEDQQFLQAMARYGEEAK